MYVGKEVEQIYCLKNILSKIKIKDILKCICVIRIRVYKTLIYVVFDAQLGQPVCIMYINIYLLKNLLLDLLYNKVFLVVSAKKNKNKLIQL